MKQIILLSISFFIAGCIPKVRTVTVAPDPSPSNIGSTFQPYLTKFLSNGKSFNKTIQPNHLTITFNSSLSGSNTLGQCILNPKYPTLGQRIEINPEFWANVGVAAREYVLFHEFGHCLLLRDHDNEEIETDDGYFIQKSIMSTYFTTSEDYTNNYSSYLHELFTSNTVNLSFFKNYGYDPGQFSYAYYSNTDDTLALTATVIHKTKLSQQYQNKSNSIYSDLSHFSCED